MADDEAKIVKDRTGQYLSEVIGVVVLLYLIVMLVGRFTTYGQSFFANRGFVTGNAEYDALLSKLFYLFSTLVLIFTVISNILATFFLMGIIYAKVRTSEIKDDIKRTLYPPLRPVTDPATAITTENPDVAGTVPVAYYVQAADRLTPGQKAWTRIQEHINSGNPSDWRVAILESDIILGQILNSLQLPGDSIGEKLKAVEPSDFVTIENAWEAHKIRNQVAHSGGEFLISEREAKRVVALYESVFREFDYI